MAIRKKYIISFLTLPLLGTFMTSCIPIFNFDSEWTYPEIIGFVKDTLNEKPLSNVLVIADNGDNALSNKNGFFHFKAKSEFIAINWAVMDPGYRLHLKFEKSQFTTKELVIDYKKIMLERTNADTLKFGAIYLQSNNTPIIETSIGKNKN